MLKFVIGAKQVLARPTQGTSQAETRHRLLSKAFTVAEMFAGPGVQYEKFKGSKFYVWQLQDAAQKLSARTPDRILLVQYPSGYISGCVVCGRGLGVIVAKFTVNHASMSY